MHDVLVKAWAMWGDYLENIFVKDRQLHLGVSAITCYLHACRHQNESKSRKYLAKVIRELGRKVIFVVGVILKTHFEVLKMAIKFLMFPLIFSSFVGILRGIASTCYETNFLLLPCFHEISQFFQTLLQRESLFLIL